MLAVWAQAASPGSASTAASDRWGPCLVPHRAIVAGVRLFPELLVASVLSCPPSSGPQGWSLRLRVTCRSERGFLAMPAAPERRVVLQASGVGRKSVRSAAGRGDVGQALSRREREAASGLALPTPHLPPPAPWAVASPDPWPFSQTRRSERGRGSDLCCAGGSWWQSPPDPSPEAHGS